MSVQDSGSRFIGRSDTRPAKVFLIFASGITLGVFLCQICLQPYFDKSKSESNSASVVNQVTTSSADISATETPMVVASEMVTPIR